MPKGITMNRTGRSLTLSSSAMFGTVTETINQRHRDCIQPVAEREDAAEFDCVAAVLAMHRR